MNVFALVLPLLVLAAPTTKPASVNRFTVELRAVEFDWPLPADAPMPREFDQRLTQAITQAALGAPAKPLWTLSTSAQRDVPFDCTAVIDGKTHFLKGTLRRSSEGEFLASIDAGATWPESKRGDVPPMINTQTVKTTVMLKLDEPHVINSCAPSSGSRKATAYTVCVKPADVPR